MVLMRGSEKDFQLESYVFHDPSTGTERSFDAPTQAASKHLSVIVPSYNEEDRIAVMLDETVAYLQGRAAEDDQFGWEIVIVDDGSRDRTTPLALEYVERYGVDNIRVLTLKKNVGKGGAVRRVSLLQAAHRRVAASLRFRRHFRVFCADAYTMSINWTSILTSGRACSLQGASTCSWQTPTALLVSVT